MPAHHSPAPWHADAGGTGLVFDADRNPVAVVSKPADLPLVIAAPNLYAACRALHRALSNASREVVAAIPDPALEALLQALAKVEGGST